MNKFKPHTRNQRIMYRIHKQEERIYDLELLVGSLQRENKKLKEQLGKYKIELEKADSITQSCIFDGKKESKISYRKLLNLVKKNKTQQKEFIEWLENEIQKRKDYGASFGLTIDRDIAEYISEKIDVYKKVLSKYKEIMGDEE